jgi:hypothetical protein
MALTSAIGPDEARSRGSPRGGGGSGLSRSRCHHHRAPARVGVGVCWLEQIARPDSGLSVRTIADFSWTWEKYVDSPTYSVPGLTHEQANDPNVCAASSIEWQQWGGLCREYAAQSAAEAHGSASAKKAKSVLHGVIGYAVDKGVLPSDATRQVRTVTSAFSILGGAITSVSSGRSCQPWRFSTDHRSEAPRRTSPVS